MNTFQTGAIASPKDKRDLIYEDVVASAGEPFDWDKGFDIEEKLGYTLKTKDQNGSYSCGGQAFGYYAEILDLVHDKEKNEKSARFIYAPIAYPGGGSTARDLSDRLIKVGACNESLVSSYDNGKAPTEAFMVKEKVFSDEILNAAKTDRAESYVASGSLDIDSVAKLARDNNGCVIGISGKDNGTWLTEYPHFTSPTTWNHWVYVIGAKKIKGIKYIKIINSWGTRCGKNGRQWLEEDFFPNACFEARAIIHNDNPPPAKYTYKFLNYLWLGQKNMEVLHLQRVLQAWGYLPKGINIESYYNGKQGFYGDITRQAVSKFQYDKKVANPIELWTNNGKFVGPATIRALNNLINTK